MAGWWSWFKSLTVVHLIMSYIYLSSGILVSFLMLVGMVIWPFSKTLYRKFVYFLSYAQWSQFSFIAHWWSNADCKLYISPEDQRMLGKEHCVCMVNHTYEIDWLMAWMMAERHGMLGLLLFPEGTRWTPEKHAACQRIAKEKVPTVVDLTVGFPANQPEPTFMDVVAGKKVTCSMIARRYAISDIPSSEEECGQWLRDLYKRKDNDLIHYKETGEFEGLPVIDIPRRYYDVCWYIFWTIFMCVPLFQYLTYVILAASMVHKLIMAAIIVALMTFMKMMIRFTEVKHGTSYGLEHKKSSNQEGQTQTTSDKKLQ
ncbi:PLCC-like protein [Mya arenaria]|uniref:PLCC-like protein n=1 Tax=Mya arenaria TaxID=6604 RepID=A0ABY7EBI9_MYAAR|nr:PLCC-like protein [Mya arenaria]